MPKVSIGTPGSGGIVISVQAGMQSMLHTALHTNTGMRYILSIFYLFIYFRIFILTTIKPIYKQLNALRANCLALTW